MKTQDNFSSLDFLRALSSLIVAWGHSRFLMLVPSAEVVNITKLDYAIYFFAGLGPQAVIVFFVLSGFFITRSVENRLAKNIFILNDYFRDRYFRLSVVAIPAVFLTLILDKISIVYLSNDVLYQNRLEWLDNSSYSASTFIGNLFYLQTLFFNSFGSNGPLWSLAYEWWFYVLAPFIILPARNKEYKYYLILFVISVFLFLTNPKILIYFIYWFFGSLAYYISNKNFSIKLNCNLLVFMCSIMLFVSASITRLRFVDKILGDFLISVSVAALIYFLIKRNKKMNNKILAFFTKISYSLYAVHLPVIIFLVSTFGCFNHKLQPTLTNTLLNFVLLILVIIISYGFWYVFERNTSYFKSLYQKVIK